MIKRASNFSRDVLRTQHHSMLCQKLQYRFFPVLGCTSTNCTCARMVKGSCDFYVWFKNRNNRNPVLIEIRNYWSKFPDAVFFSSLLQCVSNTEITLCSHDQHPFQTMRSARQMNLLRWKWLYVQVRIKCLSLHFSPCILLSIGVQYNPKTDFFTSWKNDKIYPESYARSISPKWKHERTYVKDKNYKK